MAPGWSPLLAAGRLSPASCFSCPTLWGCFLKEGVPGRPPPQMGLKECPSQDPAVGGVPGTPGQPSAVGFLAELGSGGSDLHWTLIPPGPTAGRAGTGPAQARNRGVKTAVEAAGPPPGRWGEGVTLCLGESDASLSLPWGHLPTDFGVPKVGPFCLNPKERLPKSVLLSRAGWGWGLPVSTA